MTVLLKLLHFTEEENNELAIVFCSFASFFFFFFFVSNKYIINSVGHPHVFCSFVEMIAVPFSMLWHDISLSFANTLHQQQLLSS
jgi:hypothetical protein